MREPKTRTIYNDYDLWDNYKDFAIETLSEYDTMVTDDAIWNIINDGNMLNWKEVKEQLETFFDDGTWILRGTVERWDGTYEAGTIFTNFMCMYKEATKDCDCTHLYDQNGHFHIQCAHHDGTNHYEIRKLTDKGINYLMNWKQNWNDKRTEQYVRDKLIQKYSVLPHFAYKVYGCPKMEFEERTA